MSIEIKKSHRGLFTKFAQANGLTVAEAAAHVMANKEDYSPERVKQAIFAHNFNGKAEGGIIPENVLANGGLVNKYKDGGKTGKKELTFNEYMKLSPEDKKAYDKSKSEIKVSNSFTVKPKQNNSTILNGVDIKGLKPSLNEPKSNVVPQYTPEGVPIQTTGGLDYSINPSASTDNLKIGSEKKGKGVDTNKVLGLLGEGRNIVSGLANYVLPYKQIREGAKAIAAAGPRPVDRILSEFESSLNRAQAQAQYGYTPEEQALLNNQNINLLNAEKAAARNYSGGSASNALVNEREAANQSFGRGLQAAVQNRQLQLNKQQYADQLVGQKQELSRRLFNDTMNAFQQNQQSGAALQRTGIENALAAKHYSDVAANLRQLNRGQNDWINNITLPQ